MENKLSISALVVSFNEGYLLDDCLRSISFCNEIVLVDLCSTDDTVKIGELHGCNVKQHKKVDMVEELFSTFIPELLNDWVMLIDPDERIDPLLKKDIEEFFKNIPEDCGRIHVPIQYYYKNWALKGTVWGGNKSGRLLVKRSACQIGGTVHTAIELKEGFKTYRIHRKGNNVDHHYWVQTYEQMLEKHKRYTEKEGKSKYIGGERYNSLNLIKKTCSAFYDCFYRYKGYKDGFLGLFLSCFYSWYTWSSYISLKKYQKSLKNG